MDVSPRDMVPVSTHVTHNRGVVNLCMHNLDGLAGGIDWQAWMAQHLGYDLERKLYDLIRMLKCAPWWEEYEMHRLKVHHDKGTLPLDGFHYLLRGIEFDRMYKQVSCSVIILPTAQRHGLKHGCT